MTRLDSLSSIPAVEIIERGMVKDSDISFCRCRFKGADFTLQIPSQVLKRVQEFTPDATLDWFCQIFSEWAFDTGNGIGGTLRLSTDSPPYRDFERLVAKVEFQRQASRG
jgi:hypothetical protein